MNKLMNKLRKNKKGFTLIELIVVIAILGILVLLAAPRFLGYTKDANVATMQADAKVLANAALVYNIENEATWPITSEGTEQKIGEVTVKAAELDETKFKDHVQTLKNKIGSYVMVTENVTSGDVKLQEGDILYKAGVKDKKENTHYGVNFVVKAAVGE